MPRLPYVDPSDAPESVANVLLRTPLTLLRMVAHAESAFEDWLPPRHSLPPRARVHPAPRVLTVLELAPALRELAILQVAHLERSQYEWVQHVAIGQALGVSAAQVTAIERDDDFGANFGEDETAVLRLAREFVLDGAAGEKIVSEVVEHIGVRGVIELLIVLGHYI